MRAVVGVEWLKLRRSRQSWIITALLGVGVPALTTGFIAAATKGPPDSSLAIKVNAMLIGEGWSAYLSMLAQLLSVTMLLGVGLVVAWSFGREFTDSTLASLFALPTSRSTIAAAKFFALTGWSVGVCCVVMLVAFAFAPVLALGMPTDEAMAGAIKVFAVGLSGCLLALPLGFVASATRGYMGAVGALILIVVVTQVITVIGAGTWFPYAAPSLWAGMGGQSAAAQVQPYHLMLVPITAALGVAGTIVWWRRAQVI